jgi:hypothetical protein
MKSPQKLKLPPPPVGFKGKYSGEYEIVKPTSVSKYPKKISPPKLGNYGPPPTPGKYYHTGHAYQRTDNEGVSATFYVTDPSVPQVNQSFFCAWPMVHARDREMRIQAGWVEPGGPDWQKHGVTPNKQYVFEHDTLRHEWRFFGQYPIHPRISIQTAVNHQGGGSWAAWPWWDNQWKCLAENINIGLFTPEVTSVCGEVYTAGEPFYVPPTRFNPVYLIINGRMELWTQQYPTQEVPNRSYYARWHAKYHDWEFYGGR